MEVPKIRMGDLLVRAGLLREEQLQAALELQRKWGTRLGDIVLAKGWVRPFDLYTTLAAHYGKPFVNLMREPPDPKLLSRRDLLRYSELLVIPWRLRDGVYHVAVVDPGEEAMAFVTERFGDNVELVFTSKFDVIWHLQQSSDSYFSELAVNDLAECNPLQSARYVFTNRQLAVLAACLVFALLAFSAAPIGTLILFNVVIAVFFLFNFGMRALLVWVGGAPQIDIKVTDREVAAMIDRELPTYTVLVPMYREAAVLPKLTAALRRLDYPLAKLDVKLILEEDDEETILAAKELGLEGIFEIIRVPPSFPKTKPKACNYALHFARGEYVTIYDAEDMPEPDQLKKVINAFRKAPANTACIQARLNYFNSTQNWLTRMFTLEYSLWFDFYLPALEALKIPIPLGGTSNHFQMRVLKQIKAWDPYNVTEDADLGVRLTQRGYRVGVVNSTTFEEANSRVGNWIRQRSRWIKGYMQTYLVHMRHPRVLYRSLGHVGFWGFQFFIGGTILNMLIVPFLYGAFALWLVTGTRILETIYPQAILYLSLFNLLFGNTFLIYIAMVGAFKRRYFTLIPYAVLSPFYWLLMSVAAYKAFWQLIHNPFYWEKTTHGLSDAEAGDVLEAVTDLA
ncbi:MAG: glycosyltransferase [Desulfobulbaceae bacterium]|nr:glycosyltransferase [Desulfobulbaceae bacterium]